MDKEAQLTSVRKHRGVVKVSVIHLEDPIQIYELRRELSNVDKLVIQHLLKKLEEQDAEFRKYHYTMVELLEEDADLEEEQAKLEDHYNKISDFISRLQVLVEIKGE